jgi:hypothetical protein
VNDLKSFVTLQARLYEFLAQQDETTLQAIASGTAQLAVLGAEAAPRPPSPDRPLAPSSEPLQVARDLSKLPSEDERRIYLNSAKLPVKGLREVARSMGMRGYSGLARARLIALLANHGPNRTEVTVPRTPAPARIAPVDDGPEPETSEEVPSPVEAPRPGVDVVAVAAHLRELETEEDGAGYLHEQSFDRETLLAVAAELQLTRVTRLSQAELEKRVLKQAIGARRKFAGLRKW